MKLCDMSTSEIKINHDQLNEYLYMCDDMEVDIILAHDTAFDRYRLFHSI